MIGALHHYLLLIKSFTKRHIWVLLSTTIHSRSCVAAGSWHTPASQQAPWHSVTAGSLAHWMVVMYDAQPQSIYV